MDSDSSTGWRFQWDEVKNLANIKSMVWTLSMWRRCFAVYSSWIRMDARSMEIRGGLGSARFAVE
jgi:hypothetical protein